MSIGDPFMPGFYFKQNTRSTKLFKCFFKTHIKQSQQQQQPMGGGGGGKHFQTVESLGLMTLNSL